MHFSVATTALLALSSTTAAQRTKSTVAGDLGGFITSLSSLVNDLAAINIPSLLADAPSIIGSISSLGTDLQTPNATIGNQTQVVDLVIKNLCPALDITLPGPISPPFPLSINPLQGTVNLAVNEMTANLPGLLQSLLQSLINTLKGFDPTVPGVDRAISCLTSTLNRLAGRSSNSSTTTATSKTSSTTTLASTFTTTSKTSSTITSSATATTRTSTGTSASTSAVTSAGTSTKTSMTPSTTASCSSLTCPDNDGASCISSNGIGFKLNCTTIYPPTLLLGGVCATNLEQCADACAVTYQSSCTGISYFPWRGAGCPKPDTFNLTVNCFAFSVASNPLSGLAAVGGWSLLKVGS